MQAEPVKMTYSEVMEKLREHPDLRPGWKAEVMSAVRRYVKKFEPAGMGAVTDPTEISATLGKATPAMARLAPSSFANMISRLRVALRLCGVIVQPSRHTVGLAEPWATLFQPITDHTARSRLSRFFHTASRHGWNPEGITAEHFCQYHQELNGGAILKDAGRRVRETARQWNRLADQNPALPHVDFSLPKKRQPYTLSWDNYPATLEAEERELLCKLGSSDFLSKEPRPPLRPTTLKLREFQLRQFAAALVHRGRVPSELQGLRDLCSLTSFQDGLRFFYDRAGGKVTLQIIGLAEAMYSIAKHHIATDATDLAEMTQYVNQFRSHRTKGLTEKNHRRLAQFDAPRNRDGLLLLPQQLWRAAASGRASGHFSGERAAAVMTAAVAIEILLMCPMRVGNLAALDLKRHLRRTHDRRFVTTHIYIPKEETKNRVELHCELPSSSAGMLEAYIEQFRPDMPGAENSSLLFPGRKGQRRSQQFWKMISDAGRQYVGVKLNLHLFRHIAAKFYLDENPGGYEVVRRALGHDSMNTTSRFYAGQETGRSIKHYDRVILKLQSEALQRPRNPGPRSRK